MGLILLDLEATSIPNMETFFDFLENLVSKINMDPICRTTVLKSSPVNPKYLSAIIVIAQSHISLHYNYETKKIYADIFSCAPFDYSSLDEEYDFEGLCENIAFDLVNSNYNFLLRSNVMAPAYTITVDGTRYDVDADLVWDIANYYCED